MGKAMIAGLELDGVTPVVAVPVVASTLREAEEQWRAAAQAEADLVEWRLDYLGEEIAPAAVAALANRLKRELGLPVLATVRTAAEGGQYRAAADYHAGKLRDLVRGSASWADAVDVEMSRPGAAALVAELQVPVVASFHEFLVPPEKGQVLDKLLGLYGAASAAAPGQTVIPKVAWMVADATQLETVLLAQEQALNATGNPVVVIGMGSAGAASRLGAPAARNAFTFAVVGASSAPGQPGIEELRQSLTA